MAKTTRVGDLLIKAGVIDELQLRSALAQYDQWGGRLGKIVAEMGLADEDTIAQAIAKGTGSPRSQLGHITRDAAAMAKLDAAFCEKHGVFPVQLKDNGKTLLLAMADPTTLDVIDLVAQRVRARVIPLVAGETEIAHAVMRYYRNMDPSAASDSRARMAVRRAGDDNAPPEEQEFSVTQMGQALRPSRVREPELDPSELATDPGMGRARSSSLIAELDAQLGADAELTAEERTRVEAVHANQEKSSKILRALTDLLLEKGALTRAELQARTRS